MGGKHKTSTQWLTILERERCIVWEINDTLDFVGINYHKKRLQKERVRERPEPVQLMVDYLIVGFAWVMNFSFSYIVGGRNPTMCSTRR